MADTFRSTLFGCLGGLVAYLGMSLWNAPPSVVTKLQVKSLEIIGEHGVVAHLGASNGAGFLTLYDSSVGGSHPSEAFFGVGKNELGFSFALEKPGCLGGVRADVGFKGAGTLFLGDGQESERMLMMGAQSNKWWIEGSIDGEDVCFDLSGGAEGARIEISELSSGKWVKRKL